VPQTELINKQDRRSCIWCYFS